METGRQGDKEIRGHCDSGSLSPPLPVSLSIVFGIVAAVALGWISAQLNVAGLAPVGLLPLAIGIALGITLSQLATTARVTYRRRLIVVTVLAAVLVVFSEHAWLYRDFCRQWREARVNHAQVATFRPEMPWSPSEYLAHEATPGRLMLWCIDAALIVTSALVALSMRRRRFANPRMFPTPDP